MSGPPPSLLSPNVATAGAAMLAGAGLAVWWWVPDLVWVWAPLLAAGLALALRASL